MKKSKSFELVKKYLAKEVEVKIDRPKGSKHPKHGFSYCANYGFIPGTYAPDGKEIDAYFLGINKPLKKAKGKVIAIIHRLNDDDDKLVVVPKDKIDMKNKEIKKSVHFQEQFFKYKIVR